MRFAGTISIPEDVFKAMLEASGRSFKQHGFVDVVLIGDSGDYQADLKAVAARLNRDWAATAGARAFHRRVLPRFAVDYCARAARRGLERRADRHARGHAPILRC